ncbi:MAG: Gx transporter family protein [Lachnospiraceae bacterium]|jgi:heptaprenyl diphosphate synthase|nr:Gx transporter family protein [Lachnospiraceae bacterium]
MKQRSKGAAAALLGMMLALALLCSYIETLIPMPLLVPGIKIGLANLVVLAALYLLGTKEALALSLARIFLSGFLFGNMFAVVYSLAGGILSFCVMLLLKQVWKYNILTVSVAGGISHNLGQLLIAAVVVENANLLYYMSILFFSGLVTGAVIGLIGREVILRLEGLEGRS